ncbi:MAG TPA: SAF domain-containing protein [Herpetosiphonaceae bacterium]
MDLSTNPSSHQSLAPKRSQTLPMLILMVCATLALLAAAYGYYQQSRTERVVIATTLLRYGQPITEADLATIDVPFHRVEQLAGMTDPKAIVGKWAARDIGPNDLLNRSMLLDRAPDQPVYPSGETLGKNMVPLPFSTETIGPLTSHDLVNIGFNDETGDPARCMQLGGEAVTVSAAAASSGVAQPFACRMITGANVLYVEDDTAYIELTPSAAHAVWALQAAELKLWGERYGATSDPLPPVERLDPSQITPDTVILPMTAITDTTAITGTASLVPGGAKE